MGQVLEHVAVIERGAFVAAPLAGKTLAQLGADVIRVDPTSGASDWTRWPLGPGGQSLYWAELNRGKRSVLVDTRHARGRELLADLVTAAGAYLTNLDSKPPLTPDLLRARRPDLIHVRIEGNRGGRTAVDYTVNAALGHPMVLGPPDHAGPINHQLPAWDLTTGLLAAVAVLAGVVERHRSGRGSTVSTSLMDVAISLTSSLGMLSEAQLSAAPRQRIGNAIYGAFGKDFRTRDGHRVMVAAVSGRQWQALVEATGKTALFQSVARELGSDFGRDSDRYAASEVIAGLLAPWFESRDLTEVRTALDKHAVCWDTYQHLTDFMTRDSRSSLANPIMFEDSSYSTESLRVAGGALAVGSEPNSDPPTVPCHGQHTDQILSDLLGLNQRELGRLHDRGIIASRAKADTQASPSTQSSRDFHST